MASTIILWTVLTCVVCASYGAAGDQLPADWIDPLDPLSHDPTKIERDYNKYMENKKLQKNDHSEEDSLNQEDRVKPTASQNLAQCPTITGKSCDSEKKEIEQLNKIIQKKPVPQMPYFRQFVARFAKRVKDAHLVSFSTSNHFEVGISLTDADIQVLENFAHSTDGEDRDNKVRHTHAVLENMIMSVKQVDVPEEALVDWKGWLLCISWVVGAFSSAVIAIHLQWRSAIPWKRVVGSTFVLLFLISVPWNWWHLYQKEMATRMAKSQMPAPVECRPQDMDLFQYLVSGLSVQDKCKDFYHSLHVDPWVEIPPTKAVAVTITKFILEPLEHLGESLGKMIKAAIIDLPVHLWPVALCFMLIVSIMLLIMGFGYKIRMFYLFGLEPNQPAIQPANQQMIDQINQLQGQNQNLIEQIGTVQHMLEDHTKIIEEQIGQPQPLALPSVQPGELRSKSTAPPYPAAASTPYPAEYTGSQPVYPEVTPMTDVALSGSEIPPRAGFVPPPPAYDSVETPIRHREKRGERESRVEDVVNTETQEDTSMSRVYSPDSSRVYNNGRGRKKKIQAVKSLSDSSIAAQCGHTREEDKIATRGRRKSSRDHDHSRADITDKPDYTLDYTTAESTKAAGESNEGVLTNIGSTMVSSTFDTLARNIAKDSIQPTQTVEDVGSQHTEHGDKQVEESSDDSDLEIIEEEPENILNH